MEEIAKARATFRRSLGPYFWCVPVFAVFFALSLQVPIAYPLDERSQEVAREIKSVGGTIGYNSIQLEEVSDSFENRVSSFTNVSTGQAIRTVFLRNSVVPSQVLSELKSLTHLEQLVITNCEVAVGGLGNLESLENLLMLNLGTTRVTASDLKHLQGMKRLEYLDLGRTGITDEDLVHLKALTSVTGLFLSFNGITDEGLKHLQGMDHLKRLGLFETQTTVEGRATLRAALPNCTIFPLEN